MSDSAHERTIRELSEKYDMPEEKIEDIVQFMWLQINNAMNDPRLPEIQIKEFGTWKVKISKLVRDGEHDLLKRILYERFHGNKNYRDVPPLYRKFVWDMYQNGELSLNDKLLERLRWRVKNNKL